MHVNTLITYQNRQEMSHKVRVLKVNQDYYISHKEAGWQGGGRQHCRVAALLGGREAALQGGRAAGRLGGSISTLPHIRSIQEMDQF